MDKIGILHYSAPPVVGGVENVILAHARLFVEADYSISIFAGRGEQEALPQGAEFIHIPELDSEHPQILKISQQLEQGHVPNDFDAMAERIENILLPQLNDLDMLIVHNVLTKQFNLPLTAALFRLLERNAIPHCVAWCHDLAWTSPRSRLKVFQGFPWDLLRTYRSEVMYVTVSQERQKELSELFGCSADQIRVIYNGVNATELLALSNVGLSLIQRLNLWDSDLNFLMPVRVTHAKNFELAIHVAAALKAKGIHPKFVVTGPPDPHDPQSMAYFQQLLALCKQLKVDEEVHFIYEASQSFTQSLVINMPIVTELYRLSDALFMPSHHEGFGMPILEAGLVGLPIFCADTIPAAQELAAQEVVMFSPDANPDQVAELILHTMNINPAHRLKQHVRQILSWQSIFEHNILPLIRQSVA